jgi:hypothetical protein
MFVPIWPPLPPKLLLMRKSCTVEYPFNIPNATFFYRASSAIYYLFKHLGNVAPGPVLVPDFHSGNEVAAIRASGMRLETYPVGTDLMVDLEALRRLCLLHRPRAVVFIHILGFPQPIEEILRMRDELDFTIVEDCAHALYGEYGGRPMGSFGEYGIFCPYKTLPVPNGGVLVQGQGSQTEPNPPEFVQGEFLPVASRTASMMADWISTRIDWFGLAIERVRPAIRGMLDSISVRRLGIGEM